MSYSITPRWGQIESGSILPLLSYAANMLTDDNINLIGTIINKVDMEEYKRQRSDYDYFNDEKYVRNSRNKKKRRKGNK